MPSTSGWPLPMNTLSDESPSATTVTLTLDGQLVDELIALVEQIVGRLAGLLDRDGDVAVQACDALRERGNFARFAAEPGVHLGRHLAQARRRNS